jgi:UDP-glucuronate 4-epimerase
VTGAAGFVGLHIARRLADCGEDVIALGRGTPDSIAAALFDARREHMRFVSGDVRDRDGLRRLIAEQGVRRIVHAAAVTPSPDDERADPAAIIDINLGGTLNVLEAARHGAVERVVFISSTAVYGSPEGRELPIREDQPLTISGMYTIAKQACEHMCARYAELYGMSVAVGRLGTAYGPLERRTNARARMSQVHTLAHAALEGRVPMIYGADQPRDICYVEDVAEAFTRLVRAERLNWPVYNVSAGVAHSLHTIATVLSTLAPGFTWQETTNPLHADLVVLPANARGPLDLSRLQQDTGFVPAYPMLEGLRCYFDWLRASHNENVV